MDTPGQETKVDAPESPAPRHPSPEELAAIVAAHKTWLKSKGAEGQQADLRNADLSEASLRGADLQRALMTGADLTRADLRGANLRKLDLQGVCLSRADLTGATLTLANLRDVNLSDARARRADLSRTDLCHADLSGASLQGADLSRALLREADLRRANARDASFADADLSGCRGLLIGQLGGANLGGAILPPELKFEGLSNVAEVSKGTQNLFTSLLLVCAYIWLTIASTIDAQLLNNAAPVASRLPILGTDIPLIRFYAVAPLLLLCMYIYFHMGLQRLWEELADLPAVFPDGRPLDKKAYPWLLNVLIRAYLVRLNENRSPLSRWQARISVLLAWGLVPLTMFMIWARYLRSHDWLMTGLHVALLSASIGGGSSFLRLAASTLQGSEKRAFLWKKAWKDARAKGVLVTLGMAALFGTLSFGAIDGWNPDLVVTRKIIKVAPPSGFQQLDPRSWVPLACWWIGYKPFAHLDDAAISTAPPTWSIRRDDSPTDDPTEEGHEHHSIGDLDAVKGADLERRNLRYASAYNAFMINSYLRYARLDFADLRNSDLRKADLRDTTLRHANLYEADLRGADLKRADLSNTRLYNTRFALAKLLNANLNQADLELADLYRAELGGADLTDAKLLNACLRETTFTPPEDALPTRFVRANLTGADLSDTDLTGVVLDGAILTGTDLRGSDLSGALGLTRAQVLTAVTDNTTLLPASVRALARKPRAEVR